MSYCKRTVRVELTALLACLAVFANSCSQKTMPSAPRVCVPSRPAEGMLLRQKATSTKMSRMIITRIAPHSKSKTAFNPSELVSGPNNSIWFVDYDASEVGYYSPSSKHIIEYTLLFGRGSPSRIALGPGKTILVAEVGDFPYISRVTFDGVTSQSAVPPGVRPQSVTVGSANSIWYVFDGGVGELDSNQRTHVFPVPLPSSEPYDITRGPDGNVWFTDGAGFVGSVSPDGRMNLVNTGINSDPFAIVMGPDCKLYVTDDNERDLIALALDGAMKKIPLKGLSSPTIVSLGPDHRIWIGDSDCDCAGEYDEWSGAFVGPVYLHGGGLTGLAAGSDQSIYFGEPGYLGRIEFVR